MSTIIQNPIIIGLVGFKESGKTFLSSHLQKAHGFSKIAFALGLKKVGSDIFNIVMAKDGIVHNTSKNEEFLNRISNKIEYYKLFNAALGYVGLSASVEDVEPYKVNEIHKILIGYYTAESDESRNEFCRKFWQYFGTEVAQSINLKTWVDFTDNVVEEKINRFENRIVIEDIRFSHEFEYFEEASKKYNIKTMTIGIMNNKSKLKEKTVGYTNHKSEIAIDGMLQLCDKLIVNNYDDKFLQDIDSVIKKC